jgi:hypothetical protein
MSTMERTLVEADKAFNDGDIDAAQRGYEQVLEQNPDCEPAKVGLARIRSRKEKAEVIANIIQEGDLSFEKKRYRDAETAYNRAKAQGGQERIFDFHTDLDHKLRITRDLVLWAKKVQEVSDVSLHAPGDQQTRNERLRQMDQLLNELPRNHDHYHSLVSKLKEVRDQLEQDLQDQERVQEAASAFDQEDYEKVLRLCDAITSELISGSPQVKERREKAAEYLNDYIRPAIKKAQQARERGHWQEALEALEPLKKDFPGCPDWKQLWSEVNLEHGKKAMEAGQEFNRNHEFDKSIEFFNEASNAFKSIQENSPDHPTVSRMIQETQDLSTLTSYQQQAQRAREEQKPGDALSFLMKAADHIASAEQSRNISFPVISAEIDRMRKLLEDEKQRIEGEQRRLREAGRFLKDRQLDEAERAFAEIETTTLRPEVRAQAEDGLNRARAEIRNYQADVGRGQVARTPDEAVEAFQSAYDCWPHHPDASRNLEAALVKAGESARERQDTTQAATWFKRALEINPTNSQAREGEKGIELEAKVNAILQDVQAKTTRLEQQAPPASPDFEPLLQDLEDIHKETAEHSEPRFQGEVAGEIQKLRHRQAQWQRYESLLRQAEEQRDAGEWDEAVRGLEQALQALHPTVPEAVREQMAQWRAAQQEMLEVRTTAEAHLTQARNAYDQAQTAEDFAAVLTLLAQVGETLSLARTTASRAGGKGGPHLDDLETRVAALRSRAETARQSLQAPPDEGVQRVRAALQHLAPEQDTVLERLEQQLDGRIRTEMVPRLLDEVQTAATIDQALDLLRRIRQVCPDHPEATQRYENLQLRRKIDDIIRQTEVDVQSKLDTNSFMDAVAARRRGLELIALVRELPQEIRNILTALLTHYQEAAAAGSSDTFPIGFSDDQQWEGARSHLQRFSQIEDPTGTTFVIATAARKWANAQRDADIQGHISSLAELQEFEEAYEWAKQQVKVRPDDPDIATQLRDLSNRILSGASDSARKRLERAKELLGNDYAPTALENLRSIEEEIYQPLEDRFPELVKGYPDVEKIRAEAETLRLDAEKRERIHQEFVPILEQAEQYYAEGGLDEAERELRKLRENDLEQTATLKGRAKGLRETIVKARKQNAQKDLTHAIIEAEEGLRMAAKHEDLKAIRDKLKKIRETIPWEYTSDEEQQKYYEIIERVRKTLTSLEESEEYQRKANEAATRDAYEEEEEALEQALTVARNLANRIDIETRLNKVRNRLAEQKTRHQALETGHTRLAEGKYIEALGAFRQARDLGASMGNLLKIAEAGMFLESAGTIWETSSDLLSAQHDLKQARDLIANASEEEAERLSRAINTFEWKMHQADTARREIRKILREVADALGKGELGRAREHLDQAEERDPTNAEIQKYQQEIETHYSVRTLLKQAEDAWKDNRYPGAIALVEAALTKLPSHPEALELQQTLAKGQEASTKLQEVAHLISQKEFPRARQSLSEAKSLGIAEEALETVRRKLTTEEQEWHKSLEKSIQHALVEEDFSAAFGQCRQALNHSLKLTDEFRARIEQFQQDIVQKWVEAAVSEAETGLAQARREDDFERISVNLKCVQDQNLPLTPLQRQDLEFLQGRISEGKVEFQLQEANRLRQEEDLDSAFDFARRAEEGAKNLGLKALEKRAFSLKLNIAGERQEKKNRESQQKYNQMVNQARSTFEAARDRTDLERARNEVAKACKVVDEDREIEGISVNDAKQLQDEIDKGLQLFDHTRSTLNDVADNIQWRRFEAAHRKLRTLTQHSVSRILQDEYTRQRTLTEALYEAEQCSRQQEWDKALNWYRQILQEKPDLETLIEDDLKRCREHLTSKTIGQVRTMLDREGPQLEQARTILAEAEASDWLVPTAGNDIAYLRTSIRVHENLAQASTLLMSEDGDIDQSLELLKESHRLAQDEMTIAHISQWEALGRGIQAKQRGDLETAEAELARLPESIASEKRVRDLRDCIIQDRIGEHIGQFEHALEANDLYRAERALEQIKSLVGTDQDPRLAACQQEMQKYQDMQQRVQRSLQEAQRYESRAEWKEAVEMLLNAVQEARPSYPPVVKAVTDLQNKLVAQAQRLQNEEQCTHNQAIDFCGQALRLGERPDIADLRRRITDERENLRMELRQQIQEALARWDLDQSRILLQRGLKIDPDDFVFSDLSNQRQKMETHYSEVKNGMETGWRAFTQGHFSDSLKSFSRVLEIAPSFEEAYLWQKYSQNMQEGYREFSDEQFVEAAVLFEAATSLMRIDRNKPLTGVLGKSTRELPQLRFQAVYHALQLAQATRSMENLYHQYRHNEQQNNREGMRRALEQLVQEQHRFDDRYKNPVTPPPDFSGWQEDAGTHSDAPDAISPEPGAEEASSPSPEGRAATSEVNCPTEPPDDDGSPQEPVPTLQPPVHQETPAISEADYQPEPTGNDRNPQELVPGTESSLSDTFPSLEKPTPEPEIPPATEQVLPSDGPRYGAGWGSIPTTNQATPSSPPPPSGRGEPDPSPAQAEPPPVDTTPTGPEPGPSQVAANPTIVLTEDQEEEPEEHQEDKKPPEKPVSSWHMGEGFEMPTYDDEE